MSAPMFVRDAYQELQAERVRQDAKWGEQNHPDLDPELADRLFTKRPGAHTAAGDVNIAVRHYGIPHPDDAKIAVDRGAEVGRGNWFAIALEELTEALEAAAMGQEQAVRAEVVQLAAVCVQWVQAIDRRAAGRA